MSLRHPVSNESLLCIQWLFACMTLRTENLTEKMSGGRQIYVTWLVHMCDVTRSSCVWHDSFYVRLTYKQQHKTCWQDVKRVIDMCDMTRSHVWHDSFICVTWLILCVTWLTENSDRLADKMSRKRQMYAIWFVHMCDTTHSMCDMTHQ